MSNSRNLPLDHPRFRWVHSDVFTRRFVADCMTHACTVVASGHKQEDVCCQYGADVDLAERAAIEARRNDIAAVLNAEVATSPWFDAEEFADADYPSGKVVRTSVHNGRCIFLAQGKRGCAIHRASLEAGWPLAGTKPIVCRIYPFMFAGDELFVAREYPEYSCALDQSVSVYRSARDIVGEYFGAALVATLDAVEAQLSPRRLPLAR
jgi:Fe-S-cluster containining protein